MKNMVMLELKEYEELKAYKDREYQVKEAKNKLEMIIEDVVKSMEFVHIRSDVNPLNIITNARTTRRLITKMINNLLELIPGDKYSGRRIENFYIKELPSYDR